MRYWDKAWSLVSGCTPVSPACDNCWLAGMEYRFHNHLKPLSAIVNKGETPRFTGAIVIHPERLDIPAKTKKPATFAIWSDLFHEKVPDKFILKTFGVIYENPQHTYLICTKRIERFPKMIRGNIRLEQLGYTHKIFLGTTVENQEMADKRIPELFKCKPFRIFLSVEPMFERIIIPQGQLKQIDYVIVGCESGHHARETDEDWVLDLREQCLRAGVPLWVKQLRINGKMFYDLKISTIKKENLWKNL